MCNPNVKEVRDRLVSEGKITPEESNEIRSRVDWLCNILSILTFSIGILFGYIIWGR